MTTAIKKFNQSYRGFLCILVILFHSWGNYIQYADLPIQKMSDIVNINGLFPKLFWGSLSIISASGYESVGIFLLLSGFGLTISYKENLSYGDWVKLRLKKILPTYWFIVLLLLFCGWFLNLIASSELINFDIKEINSWKIINAIFLTPLSAINPVLTPWWYLTVLIQLYLLFPFIYSNLKKKKLLNFLLITLLLHLLCIFILKIVFNYEGAKIAPLGLCLYRLPEFILGVVLGHLYTQNVNIDRFFKIKYIPIFLVINVIGSYLAVGQALNSLFVSFPKPAFYFSGFSWILQTISYFQITLTLVSLISRLSGFKFILNEIGKYSFEIYLIHYLFIFMPTSLFSFKNALTPFYLSGALLLISYLFSMTFNKILLTLISRFERYAFKRQKKC